MGSLVPGPVSGSPLKRSQRTANVILTGGDNSSFIDITAGTFVQTFTAAATLGNGWFAYFRNSGTGDITLDPNGAELIDGLTSYVMYPGECRLVTCDGIGFTTQILAPFYRAFTATGTFVKPPGYAAFDAYTIGAGASGDKNNNGNFIFGGGGGAGPRTVFAAALVPASLTVTVGAGGAAVTVAGTAGNAGGNSSFGSLLTGYGAGTGGQPGKVMATFFDTLYSGSASYPSVHGIISGGKSTIYNDSSTYPPVIGNSVQGGGAGGTVSLADSTVGAPGKSLYAGDGGAFGEAVNGADGVAPGGGGGSTHTGAQSGAGARGEVRIWGIP
jgi:hypothetical protein